MKTRVICGCVVLVALAVGVVSGAAGADSGEKIAAGGDPYTVSASQLRQELAGSGVQIRYIRSSQEGMPSVDGVASSGGLEIGFEFQLYPRSNEATASNLGHLRAEDLGWPEEFKGVSLKKRVRGVLANVAYALYEKGQISERENFRGSGLEYEGAQDRILRALDGALFDSFPPSDPYAHPSSPTP